MTEIGVSPKELFAELRLSLARTRLLDTADTIAAIAEECGFPSAGALFEQFRQRHKLTPTEWRQLNRPSR